MTDCEYISMMKSTIVRSQKGSWFLPIVRASNRALSSLAPRLASHLAERMFLTPPRPRRPAGERTLIASAHARTVPIGAGSHVQTWTWGKGPRVLLVHGWGGRGSQLGAFVEPLVSCGFSVVAFDAPGHGESGTGLVTIPQMVARGAGRFAGIASIAGLRGLPSASVYSASKAAMQNFLEASGVELEPLGVGVSVVNPGWVRTPIIEKYKGSVPFSMSAEKAARIIANGLDRGSRTIEFPLPMSLVMRLVRVLPGSIYTRALRPYARRNIDPEKVRR